MNPGEQLGKYRLTWLLGPDVWLAERVEDFEQQVTVCFIPPALDPAAAKDCDDRLQKAGALHHPVIPRLLDSGETSGHRPYALFEFVPQVPALEWARAHLLTRPERIGLALDYLDALALAHRSLLAHGRLAASSFQVSSAGRARLEPFPCVVSSNDPVADDLRATASILAILLTENLTGTLPKDLKAILDKAESGAPYESAHALAADLGHYLDHKPVAARRHTLLDTTAMLARRRPTLVYSTALAAVFILLATVYSFYMDSAAQRSRIQAQQRLRQLQRLTYSLESELYRPVSALPKSENARATLIVWSTQSLDRLASEAGNDRELREQLARSYDRLAEVQRTNGDVAAAALSEQRARAVVALPH